MKIAFTTKGTDWNSMMDARFGRTEYILVYDNESGEMTKYDNRSVSEVAHGAGPKTAQALFELGADILITGNGPGGNAAVVLEKAGVEIYVGASEISVEEAFESYKSGYLKKI